jgi:hypothetical protein
LISDNTICLFSHFYDKKCAFSVGNNNTVSQRERTSHVIQRVVEDWSTVTKSTDGDEYMDQGLFMIHDNIAKNEGSWLILYQVIPRTDICLTMICSVRNTNRILASHILSQISLHLVASVNKNVQKEEIAPFKDQQVEKQMIELKKYLMKPELIYTCLHKFCPNGQLLIV